MTDKETEEEEKPPLSQRLQPVLMVVAKATVALSLLGIAGIIGYVLVQYRGIVGATLLILAWLAGAAFLPILTFAPLGMSGGEAIGNALFKLATLPGTGAKAINQRADDVYEWVSVDEDELHGSQRWWERFVGGRFGLTYERTREAFGDLAHHRRELVEEYGDPRELVGGNGHHPTDGGDRMAVDSTRAGFGQFLELDGEQVYVNAADKLSQLREAAGLEVSVRARAHGLAEYGGDTSDVSPWAMLAGSFLFLIAGAGMGLIILA